MSMNPTGNETHVDPQSLDEVRAIFGEDFPEPSGTVLIIVHSPLGDFVFEVAGVDFPEFGDPTPF